jgi:hypothetical protein
MLSNCAFNIAQRAPGSALTADDIRALNLSRIAWDKARYPGVSQEVVRAVEGGKEASHVPD